MVQTLLALDRLYCVQTPLQVSTDGGANDDNDAIGDGAALVHARGAWRLAGGANNAERKGCSRRRLVAFTLRPIEVMRCYV